MMAEVKYLVGDPAGTERLLDAILAEQREQRRTLERLEAAINAAAEASRSAASGPHDGVGLALRERAEPYWGKAKEWRSCGKTRVCALQPGDDPTVTVCTPTQWQACGPILARLVARQRLTDYATQTGYDAPQLREMTRQNLYRVAGALGLSPFKEPDMQADREVMIAAILAAQRRLRTRQSRRPAARSDAPGAAPAPDSGRDRGDRRQALLARRRAQKVVST
jgi:hypothetical protein